MKMNEKYNVGYSDDGVRGVLLMTYEINIVFLKIFQN